MGVLPSRSAMGICGAIELGCGVRVLEISLYVVEEELRMKPYIRNYLAHCFFSFTKIKIVKMNDQTVIGLSRTQEAGKDLNSTADVTRTSPNNAANLATCVSIN